jgi:GST-like protein
MADAFDKIQFYTYGTPNGRKVSIMLEECGLPYDVHVVDIRKGEQLTADYRKINPNQRIPTIIDPDGQGGKPVRVFESGAILLYLAEKRRRFLGGDPGTRLEAIQWLMFQMGWIGPMFGQEFHFLHQAADATHEEALKYGRERYGAEVTRLCKVLDYRLREYEFLARSYSIADMAVFPWIAVHERLGIDLGDYAGITNWYNKLKKRAAIQRGMDVPPRETMG